jgi:hypothetical protein
MPPSKLALLKRECLEKQSGGIVAPTGYGASGAVRKGNAKKGQKTPQGLVIYLVQLLPQADRPSGRYDKA